MSEAPIIPKPPAFTQRFVRYLLGFGVAVAVGLAPFLGKIKVPGFDALLQLFPADLQATLIPLAAFLMGLVAVGVQFLAGEKTSGAELSRRFRQDFGILIGAFIVLVVLYNLFVVSMPVDGGAGRAAFIVAPERAAGCGCAPELSDPACIQSLSFDPAAVESCWRGMPLKILRLALMLTYLVLMGGFAGLVGLLLVRDEQRSKVPKRRRGGPLADPTLPP